MACMGWKGHQGDWETDWRQLMTNEMETRTGKSFWSVLALMLLVDSTTAALMGPRNKRDIGEFVGEILEEDVNSVVGVIEEVEEGVVDYLTELTQRQGIQDRILLENVQVITSNQNNC